MSTIGLRDNYVGEVQARPAADAVVTRQFQKRRRRLLDREFAESDLRNDLRRAVESSRQQALPANYHQALAWIRYRCPERISLGFHRWYGDEARDRCIGVLRVALESGTLTAIAVDGREMLPAAWGFIERNAIPNVRFRWGDLHKSWPSAFLDPMFPDLGVRSESTVPKAGAASLPTHERLRHKKIFAWLVCERANQPTQRGESELNLFVRKAPAGIFDPPIAGGQTALRGSWNELFTSIRQSGRISDAAWPGYVKIAQEFLAAQGVDLPKALPSYSGGSGQPEYSYPPNF